MSLLDYNYDASSSPALSSSSTFDSSANSEYNNNPDSPSPMSMASPQSEASSPTSNILNKTKRVYHRPATDKRRSQNRDAARKFRQKKETYKQELEAQIQHLSSGNNLNPENELLKQRIAQLEQENNGMLSLLIMMSPPLPLPVSDNNAFFPMVDMNSYSLSSLI